MFSFFKRASETVDSVGKASVKVEQLAEDADDVVKDVRGMMDYLGNLVNPKIKPIPNFDEVREILKRDIKDGTDYDKVARLLSPTSYSYGSSIIGPSLLIKIRLFYSADNWLDRCLIFLDTFFLNKLTSLQTMEIAQTAFSLASKNINGFFDEQVEQTTPQGFENQIPNQAFEQIVAAIVMAGFLGVYGKAAPTDTVSKLVTKLSDKGRAIFNLSQGVRGSVALFESLVHILDEVLKIFSRTLGIDQVHGLNPKRFQNFLSGVSALDHEDIAVQLSFSREARQEVCRLQDECEDIANALMLIKHVPNGIMSQFSRCQTVLNRICRQMERTGLNQGTKIDPFCLCFSGSPGIGKSVVAIKVLNALAEKYAIPRYKRIYSRNVMDPYWSGYCHQFAVLMDDVSQFRESPNVDPYADIVSIKTNSDFRLLMADVSEKGRLFTSHILGMTTNAPYYRPQQMVEPTAFLRRRDLLVDVRRKKDVDGKPMDFSPEFHHLEFYVLNRFENVVESGPWTFAQIFDIIHGAMTEHLYNQDRVVKLLTSEKKLLPTLEELIDAIPTTPQGGEVFVPDFSSYDQYFRRYSQVRACRYLARKLYGREIEFPWSTIDPFDILRRYLPDSWDGITDYLLCVYDAGLDWDQRDVIFASYVLFGRYVQYPSLENRILEFWDTARFECINYEFLDEIAVSYYSGRSHFATLNRLVDLKGFNNAAQLISELEQCGVRYNRIMCRRQGQDVELNEYEDFYYRPILFIISGREMDGVDRIDDFDNMLHDLECPIERTVGQVGEASFNARLACTLLKDPFEIIQIPESLHITDENVKHLYDEWFSTTEAKTFVLGLAIYRLQQRYLLNDKSWSVTFLKAKDRVYDFIRSDAVLTARYDKVMVSGVSDEDPWEDLCSEYTSWWKRAYQQLKLEHPFLFMLIKNVSISIGMMLAWKAVKGLYAFMTKEPGPEETKEQMYNRDPVRRAAKRAAARSMKVTGTIPQDANAEELIMGRVSDNICRITNITAGKVVNCFRVKGRNFIVNKHFYFWCRFDDEIVINFLNKTEFRFKFDPQYWTYLQDSDIAMFQCGLSVPMGKDSTSLFVKDSDLEYLTSVEAKLVGVAQNGLPKIWQSCYKPVAKQYNVGNDGAMVVEGFTTTFATQQGDCGSVMVVLDSRSPRKLCGIHASIGAHNTSVVQLVTQEILQLLLDELYPDKIVPFVEEDCEIPVQTTPQMMDGNFTTLGEAPVYRRGATKTEIAPSLFQGMFPLEQAPSVLTPKDPRCKVSGDPLKRAVMKYGQVSKPFPLPSLKLVEDRLDCYFASFRIPRRPQVCSVDEGVNGIQRYEYFDALDMKSSPGYPYTDMRPANASGKAFLFNMEEVPGGVHYVINNEELRKRISNRIRCYWRGVSVPGVWTDCLKDEKRPIEKILQGKTRSFCMAPLDYTIVCRMYFMDFCAAFYSNRLTFFSAVGIDPTGPEWTALWNKLRAVSMYGIAGDYSAWDGTVKPDCVAMVTRAINRWYGDSEENCRVREMLIDEMIHTRSWCRKLIYQKHIGMPSGHPMTVIFNTIVNYVYLACAWLDLASAKQSALRPLALMDKHVAVAIYGDDNILAIAPEVDSFFNQAELTTYFEKYGIVYTDAAKTGAVTSNLQALSELTFLKSGFQPHPYNRQRMLSPIDPNTIYGVLNWVTNSMSVEEATVQNYHDALEFAYHHGEHFFNKIKEMCEKFLQDQRIEYQPFSYEDFDYLFGLKF